MVSFSNVLQVLALGYTLNNLNRDRRLPVWLLGQSIGRIIFKPNNVALLNSYDIVVFPTVSNQPAQSTTDLPAVWEAALLQLNSALYNLISPKQAY